MRAGEFVKALEKIGAAAFSLWLQSRACLEISRARRVQRQCWDVTGVKFNATTSARSDLPACQELVAPSARRVPPLDSPSLSCSGSFSIKSLPLSVSGLTLNLYASKGLRRPFCPEIRNSARTVRLRQLLALRDLGLRLGRGHVAWAFRRSRRTLISRNELS